MGPDVSSLRCIAGRSLCGQLDNFVPDVALPRLCRPGAFAEGRAGRGATDFAPQFDLCAMRCLARRLGNYGGERGTDDASIGGAGVDQLARANLPNVFGGWAHHARLVYGRGRTSRRRHPCSSKGSPFAAPRVPTCCCRFFSRPWRRFTGWRRGRTKAWIGSPRPPRSWRPCRTVGPRPKCIGCGGRYCCPCMNTRRRSAVTVMHSLWRGGRPPNSGSCVRLSTSRGSGVPEAAAALVGRKLDDTALAELDQAARRACKPIDDKRGTIEYRTKVAGVLARRTATIAYERAGER
jgi:CO dehydrogenase flavoprotein C-terminal domain